MPVLLQVINNPAESYKQYCGLPKVSPPVIMPKFIQLMYAVLMGGTNGTSLLAMKHLVIVVSLHPSLALIQ